MKPVETPPVISNKTKKASIPNAFHKPNDVLINSGQCLNTCSVSNKQSIIVKAIENKDEEEIITPQIDDTVLPRRKASQEVIKVTVWTNGVSIGNDFHEMEDTVIKESLKKNRISPNLKPGSNVSIDYKNVPYQL